MTATYCLLHLGHCVIHCSLKDHKKPSKIIPLEIKQLQFCNNIEVYHLVRVLDYWNDYRSGILECQYFHISSRRQSIFPAQESELVWSQKKKKYQE